MRSAACVAIALSLVGCSSSAPPAKPSATPPPGGAGPATATGKHPLAKYIELSGFRLTLGAAGQVKVEFTAINHSDADLPELGVHVRLTTTVAKPEDPPVTEFDAKVPALGPQEDHDVTLNATTRLKAYELPDWQFLRAEFDITSPAP